MRIAFTFIIIFSTAKLQAQKGDLYIKFHTYSAPSIDKIAHISEQWYDKNKLSVRSSMYYETGEFTVFFENGQKKLKTSDSITYKEEYRNHRDYLNKISFETASHLFRDNGSNILRNYPPKRNLTEQYFFEDTLVEMSAWTLLPENMTIHQFKCQKALTVFKGVTYYAWFTQELGYTGGPRNFRGLPGMILLVEDSDKRIRFEAVNIIYPIDANSKPKEPAVAKRISKQEHSKIVEKQNAEAMQLMNTLQNLQNKKDN